jgi:hypothetical protein
VAKILIEVEVNDAVQISEGVFKTTLSHPTLEGDLHFIHSSKNRESILGGLTESNMPSLTDVISLAGDLFNGTKRTKTNTKSAGETPKTS